MQLRASKCTNDDENNENNDEKKRKRGWNLLGYCSVASEAPQDTTWLHKVFLQHFFTFFLFKSKRNNLLGLNSFNLKSPLT